MHLKHERVACVHRCWRPSLEGERRLHQGNNPLPPKAQSLMEIRQGSSAGSMWMSHPHKGADLHQALQDADAVDSQTRNVWSTLVVVGCTRSKTRHVNA